MVNKDSCIVYSNSPQELRQIGSSLAFTLSYPVTILLTGTVGAGKTTFVQGLAAGLGVCGSVTSPTYALEQRYTGTQFPLYHLDLYRLTPAQAVQVLEQSDEHGGIRCIEWPDRADMELLRRNHRLIEVDIAEHGDGRQVQCHFTDASWPEEAQILQWRNDVFLPPHIAAHCDAVARFAHALALELAKRGHIVRPELLRIAGLLHDVFRFVDFRAEGSPGFTVTPNHAKAWQTWKETYPGLSHEALCAARMRELGYELLADVIAVHGLSLPSPKRTTIEQQLLYYADKRVMEDRVVTLAERFTDFTRRYGKGKESEVGKMWLEEAREIEQRLFGENAP